MDTICLKRLNKEIIYYNFDIVEYSEHTYVKTPKVIGIWKNYKYYIDVNVYEYPFQKPYIVGSNFLMYSFSHSRYTNIISRFNLDDYCNFFFHNKYNFNSNCFCIYCQSILSCDFEWTPRYNIFYIIKQIIDINCLISSAVKLNVIKRNLLYIPEDIFFYIFPFLSYDIYDILHLII